MLAATAQIAVALAGFTGVAASFAKGALYEWSPGDRLRLLFLLILSLLPLAWCLIGLFLLTTGLHEPQVWQISSGLCAIMLLAGNVPNTLSFIAMWRVHQKGTKFPVSRAFFFSSAAVGVAALGLQVYNIAVLQAFWPFFATIVAAILVGLLQFARLILQRPRKPETADGDQT